MLFHPTAQLNDITFFFVVICRKLLDPQSTAAQF
jgi:hypothetical protein